MSWQTFRWRPVCNGLLGGLLTGLCIALLTHELWLGWIGRWLAVQPDPHPADVIVALGGNIERADLAIDLYLRGLAPALWHTGDGLPNTDQMATARVRFQRSLERGVPEFAMSLLVSSSTWEDGQVIASLTRERGVRSIIVITDWYHSRRALCVIRQALDGSGVSVSLAVPPDPAFGPERWWKYRYRRDAVIGELIKLIAYAPLHGLDLRRC